MCDNSCGKYIEINKHTIMNKRFVLINPEAMVLENTGDDQTQYRVWPHNGLLYVGTAAEKAGYSVALWDELVQGKVSLENIVEPGDIVGFSLVITGIERGVLLAKEAKKLGARYCIAGNDSAIFRSSKILALAGKPIDAVFTGDSLRAITSFFSQIDSVPMSDLKISGVETNPNHTSRSNVLESLKLEADSRRGGQRDDGDVFIVPNLNLFDQAYWNTVWRNYNENFGHKHPKGKPVRNTLALFSHGCTRPRGTEVCSYCTIAEVANIRFPSDAHVTELAETYARFGINTVFNAADSSFEMIPVINTLKKHNIKWDALTIYARSRGIAMEGNQKLMEKWLSVTRDRLLLNVGMDSGDDDILKKGITKSSAGKNDSRVEENKEATRRIKQFGAHLHCSLIFGSPGETLASCRRSMEYLEWMIDVLGDQLDQAEADRYWLNFGSPASRVFFDYDYAVLLASYAGKTINRDEWHRHFVLHADELVVPPEVQKSWYRFFTRIDIETADEFNAMVAHRMLRHTGSIRSRAFMPLAT